MIETIVAGVDFSGAKDMPNQAWLATARLGSLGLELLDVRQIGSHALGKALSEHTALSLVGIDCPFSLPLDFLRYMAVKQVREDYQSWQEVAEQLVFMSLDDFIQLLKEFKKDCKRLTDRQLAVPAQSPLNRGNPSMVQMTYQGIRFLSMLDPSRFFVQPFQQEVSNGCEVIEVYPRATLNYLGLPDKGYKGEKDPDTTHGVRRQIIQGLKELREKRGVTFKDAPRLIFSKQLEYTLLTSDHALDAAIACYTSALYKTNLSWFTDPLSLDNLDVLLEGWIFAPQK